MEVVTIAANAVNAKLINPSREVKLLISEALSYQVEGADYSGNASWSGLSSFFRMRECLFPAGFVGYCKGLLEKKGYTVVLARKPLPAPLGPVNPKVDEFPEDSRYDYQMETVNQLIKRGRMIAQISTGGGKTRVSKLAYRRINRMTLFLTTRGVLMYQMKDSFEEIGEKVGIIGDSQFRPGRGFNVGMVQTFSAMLKDPARSNMALKLLEMFEFVILEEAHEAGGDGYYDILNHCKNAHYRLALTATPFMKDNSEANMRLQAVSGVIGIRVTERTLIDRGILAKPYFKFINTERPKSLFKSTGWQRAYKVGIVESAPRNQAIVFEVGRAAKYGMRSMVLVQHKAHGELLRKMMSDAGIKCLFMYGEHSQDERKRALNLLREGKIDALIGSTILDVGVDVPAVGMVVLAGGGKAEVALRQRIGRGLRAKRDMANISFIVDFCDEINNHLRDHARTRRAIIESTDGFRQGILRAGEDFNYGLLEKK